ncbi:hypothetical protein DAI22_02g056200 [Oryza sativa Japonica Group]|uniref:Knottin scorpion toxin-like domain-containing protein n=5 Tax=Oryza TaxID=4527 RepID=A0A0D3F1A6_9ORYZ|nr:hypothetical protein DAI22_02g056200 [Oryza sativa Japonica Group]
MHRMVKLLCTLLLALSLTAHYSDMSMKVSADCQSVNVPGPCSPTTCDDNCKSQIGAGAVGECTSGGCQCTFCTLPPPKKN